MKSNLTLKKLYECAFGDDMPFENERMTGEFVMSSFIASMLEAELEGKNRMSKWEIYLYFLNKAGLNYKDIENYFLKAMNKINLDATLFCYYHRDELFDGCISYSDYMLQKLGVNLDKCVDGDVLFKSGYMPLLFSKKIYTDIIEKNGKKSFQGTKNAEAIEQIIKMIFSNKSTAEVNKELQAFIKDYCFGLDKVSILKFRKEFLDQVDIDTIFKLKDGIETSNDLNDGIDDVVKPDEKTQKNTTKTKSNKQPNAECGDKKTEPVVVNYDAVKCIRDRVIGQDFALAKVANNILSASVGFRDENQPVASFLLTGPTGVGKTETAKAVADACFGGKFFVVDMSTFKNDIDVSRLLGGSPNYVGYNDPNAFCNFVKENPDSVILFDEIEKGHSSCLDLLMRILDEGEFINAKGEVVSLKGTVIFCTTNLTQNKQKVVGFNKDEIPVEQEVTADMGLKKELAGRFTEIIEYKQLCKEDCKRIAKEIFLKKAIDEFEKNNKNRLKIAYSEDFLDVIVEGANTNLFGARDIKKSIKSNLIAPISKYILENNPKDAIIYISSQGVRVLGSEKEIPKTSSKRRIGFIAEK